MAEPQPFVVMAKPAGPRCNIACDYCYYLDKTQFYPGEARFRMGPETLGAYIRGMIDASVALGQRTVRFSWQGGEPLLMGLPFYEAATDLQKRLCPEGMRIENTLQTNGMLLDAEIARFLAREAFLTGISIDGPRPLHDRYRRDRAGRGSFAAVMAGLEALRAAGAPFNILCTVHRGNAGKGREVYRFLRRLGTAHIQFIPIVERRTGAGALAGPIQTDDDPDHVAADWSVSPRAYGKFLCDVFDTWIRKDPGKVFVQHFETMAGLMRGLPPSLCVFAETCGRGLALEHNGDLYACDHYVYPEFRLGNIAETPLATLAWSKAASRFGAAKRDSLTDECRDCDFLRLCHGGCPKHRFARSQHGAPGHNHFCESYRIFLRHAGPRLLALTLSECTPAGGLG